MRLGRGSSELSRLGLPARRPERAFGIAVVLGILLVTLWPLDARPDFHDDRFSFRLLPADFVRNVLLFLPLGVVLARRGSGLLGVTLRALLLSGAIELAQVLIPGRYANGADLLGNGAGALLGAAIQLSAPGWVWPGPRAADRLALLAACALAAIVVGTGLLVSPALPTIDYYAGLTPEFGNMARYRGRIRDATIGDLSLSSGRVEDSARLRELWLSEEPIRIDVVTGPAPASLAPVLTLHDALHREVLVFGVDDADLVVRGRNWAQVIGLDRPVLRFPDALAGVKPGSDVALSVRRDGHGFCVTSGARSACPLGFTAGSGWRLLWAPQGLPAPSRDWLNGLWLAALALPLGLWLRATASGVTAVTVAACALLAAPLAGLLRTPPYELGAVAAGLLLGLVFRALLPGRSPKGALPLGARGAYP